MKSHAIERRAQLLRLYTGMPWQSARLRVEAASPGSLLIAQPDVDQLLLEARVMAALAWRQIGTVHPWGIKYVDPYPDRLLIRIEPAAIAQRASDWPPALDLAEALLPRADEHGELLGVPGVRTRIEDEQVVLHVAGTSASITLLGVEPAEWLHAVDVQDQEWAADGMTACHRHSSTRWHPLERPYRRGPAASAWLTSGLLRRVGLIRTLGVPLGVTGWLAGHKRSGGEHWVIDPEFAEGHGAAGHRRLMALLSAPGWGLPLDPVDEHCLCHLPPGVSDQCTTTSAGRADRPGVLEVRAIHRRGDRLNWIQRHRPERYEAQHKLTLTVPAWVDPWLERNGSLVPDGPSATRS
ncbi:hypothetical protein ACTWJ8_40565 (plasmid) [Streptomyces sp. SDT5-1]|uniref:hypothetical protein n=1 Tax=Streptomyces sp. SDT5-1 TaxID=3406418 RepID=UPI003FD4FBD5